MKILYFNTMSIILWIMRSVFIGILVSAFLLHDKFFGTYNIDYPISNKLATIVILSWMAFEIGILIGYRNRIYNPIKLKSNVANYKSSVIIIWIIGLLAGLIMFSMYGIPILGDPLLRAQFGYESGILKRFFLTIFPIAAIEIFALLLQKKVNRTYAFIILFITLVFFFAYTKKSLLFFPILFMIIIFYRDKLFSIKTKFTRKYRLQLLLLILIFLGSLFIYAYLVPTTYNFLFEMLSRVTNLIANAPNYIVSGGYGVPTSSEMIKNDVFSFLVTFRFPVNYSPIAYDTYLTRIILNRPNIISGGLNITVIGYGWIIAGIWGTILYSLAYGILAGFLYKKLIYTNSAMKTAIISFSLYVVYLFIQTTTPVNSLLDIGVGIIMYIVLHKFIDSIIQSNSRVLINNSSHNL